MVLSGLIGIFPLSNPFGGFFVDLSEGFDEGWSNTKIRLRVHDIIIADNNDGAHWNIIEIGSFIIPTNKFVEITGVYMDH